MIGESPHEGAIDGRDKSRGTSRLHVHAALSECRVLSRLLRDPALQLGGLLRVIHAHRVRAEHRATSPGVFRVVDLRTFAILLLDLPSWVKAHVLKGKRRADVPPMLAAEPAPAPLLLLCIHLDMLEQLPDPSIASFFLEYLCEHPEYPSGTPRRQSRIPGIPVQSLSFPESAPIPAGIPDP